MAIANKVSSNKYGGKIANINDVKGKWITINTGRKVFIPEGYSPSEASVAFHSIKYGDNRYLIRNDVEDEEIREYLKNELGITKEEYSSIAKYTNTDYKEMNDLLEGRKNILIDDNDGKEYRDTMQKQIDTLSKTLEKIPSEKGTVYSGMRMKPNVTIGDTVEFKQFLSSSKNIDIATGSGRDKGTYIIESTNGKNIAPLAKYPSEQEVIFNKGSKFKVTKIDDNKVYLKEV